MITRTATFKDYSKLAELVNNTELIAKWMMHNKENSNTLSLITIEKKKVIACFLCEYIDNTKGIESMLLLFPDGKPEIGKFLLDKSIQHFKDNKKNPEFIQLLGMFQDSGQYEKMNMKPYETNYRMELKS